jgi:hypothetical protein
MPDAVSFVVGCLAVWRVTHLVAEEDGPGGVVATIRARVGARALGPLMDCFFCLSIWLAAPFAVWLARDIASGVVTWLGLSGAACIIQMATGRKESA